jgi:hypothetical protein
MKTTLKTWPWLAGIAVLAALVSAPAATYNGNGNTGFGGAVGQGSLTLTDDGTTVSGVFTKGGGNFNDALVIYIDAIAGGASSTANFTDAGDGLRRAISGFDGGANRSTLTFPSGFAPDYAIALGPSSDSFGGLWGLVENGSHNFISSVNLSPLNNSSATYTFSFALSSIGSPTSFALLGTYISNTGYRSDEALATSVTGTQGWNPFTASGYGIYVVPEPATGLLGALGGLTLLALRRRIH